MQTSGREARNRMTDTGPQWTVEFRNRMTDTGPQWTVEFRNRITDTGPQWTVEFRNYKNTIYHYLQFNQEIQFTGSTGGLQSTCHVIFIFYAFTER